MNDEIPRLLPPEQMPPVRSQYDLCLRWRAMMGPLGFSERLLWLSFLTAERTMSPHLIQIADIPVDPEPEMLDSLTWICNQTCRDPGLAGGSLAVLLSRPGTAAITDSDRVWARGLTLAAQRGRLRMEPVHLATDERVCVFAPDDLTPPRDT